MPTAWRLKEAGSGRVLVAHLEVATTFWTRLVGLQFRSQLPQDHGLLLAPSRGIHTFWMRFPIDVTFLDRKGRVLRTLPSVRPWRIVLPVRGACAVLETAAGTGSWSVGSRVCLEGSAEPLPHALRNWACKQDAAGASNGEGPARK